MPLELCHFRWSVILSDVNRPVGRPGTVGRPGFPQDGRDGAKAVRPVLTPQ